MECTYHPSGIPIHPTDHIVRSCQWHVDRCLTVGNMTAAPAFQGYGYPAIAPPFPAPFIPPPPTNRPPTEPPPPVFMPSAAQNPNLSTMQSPPVIPGSTRRHPATPHPSASRPVIPEPVIPESQSQRQTRSQEQANTGTNPLLDPLGPSSASFFGSRPPNPLPPPPRDVYDSSPYRALLNLPQTTALLTSTYGTVAPQQEGASTSRRKSLKGLFHSLSSKRKPEDKPVPFVPVYIPQPQTTVPPTTTMPGPNPAPAPSTVPPIRFDHTGPLTGFMNHSQHRILYQNKTYPTALHLHEALKFIGHRPDLAEKIRNCPHVHEVYPLSATLQEYVRPDWGQVYLKEVCIERVLWFWP
jgi:hypothetical protein